MRIVVGQRLSDASAMTKQASIAWSYTGRPTAVLSQVDSWATLLLQHYYTNAGISTLRFGTSSGLEESFNGTANGVRVLRRDGSSATDCLKSYLADGTTSDVASAHDCNHDPRYTSWYQAGISATDDPAFSDVYNNTWLATVSKACLSDRCPTISGVWASEWQISSVGTALAALIDGFEGSLAIIDLNGVVLSTASGVTLEPALTCQDPYIREGSKEVVIHTKYFRKHWSGDLLRANFIGLSTLFFNDFENMKNLSVDYFGMMSLARPQLSMKYEQARNAGLAVICFGIIFIGVIVDKIMRKTKESLLHTFDRNSQVFVDFEEIIENRETKALRDRLGLSVKALQCHLQQHPISKTSSFSQGELSMQEALQCTAVSFLSDLTHGRDAELHLALLMCAPSCQCWLIPLFRVYSSLLYRTTVQISLFLLLWFQLVDSYRVTSVALGIFLSVLFLDAILHCMMSTIQSRKIVVQGELQSQSPLHMVPWHLKTRRGAARLYLLLVVISLGTYLPALSGKAGFGYRLVTYVAPVLVLVRSEEIWPAMNLFLTALNAAGSIVYIWNVLLHDIFETGNYMIDSQMTDFYSSLSTLSAYLIDQSNFVQVVEPALAVNGLYILFFMSVTLFSVFFVSAILLTIFMVTIHAVIQACKAEHAAQDTFCEGASEHLTLDRRKKWGALTLIHLMWTRTMQTHQENVVSELHMTPLMFEQLMFQCNLFSQQDSWIGTAQSLLKSVVAMLDQHQGNVFNDYGSEIAALATVSCKLHLEQEYQTLISRGYLAELDIDPQNESGEIVSFMPTCFEANLKTNFLQVLERTQLCGDTLDDQIEFVKRSLGTASSQEAHQALTNTTVPILVRGSCQSHARYKIRKLLSTALAISKMSTDDKVEHVAEAVELAVARDTVSKREHRANNTHSSLLQLVHQMYTIDCDRLDPITQAVSALISLVHMHAWRIRVIFDALDSNRDGFVSLTEFDQQWALQRASGLLASSALMQNEAECMLLEREIQEKRRFLQGVVSSKSKWRGVVERLETTKILKGLESTFMRLETEIKMELGDFTDEGDRLAMLQIMALLNVGAVAYLGNPDSRYQGALDWVLGAFPVFFALEVVSHVWTIGLKQIVKDCKHPDLQVAWFMGGATILVALAGTALLAFDFNHSVTSPQDAHTLASFSVLLVILYNKKFGQMTLTFGRAAASVVPTIVAISMAVVLFAVASTDLFGDKVVDPYTSKPYFDTFARSLSSMFRMFTGDWHEAMHEAVTETTEGAQLWFTAYVFVMSVFCCELFVGVVIAGYAEVQSVTSSHMYHTLASILDECGQSKRDALINKVLKLAREMRSCNQLYVSMLSEIQAKTDTENSDVVETNRWSWSHGLCDVDGQVCSSNHARQLAPVLGPTQDDDDTWIDFQNTVVNTVLPGAVLPMMPMHMGSPLREPAQLDQKSMEIQVEMEHNPIFEVAECNQDHGIVRTTSAIHQSM